MKVIFLDFDGVLNSEASFRMEMRRKTQSVADTLSTVACANLQYILEQDADVKIIISSTWRKLHSLEQLRNILTSYGVTGSRVIGKTPVTFSGSRSQEIHLCLEDHQNITKFVILDDDSDVINVKDERGHKFITTPEDGLLFKQSKQIAKLFRGEEVKYKGEK